MTKNKMILIAEKESFIVRVLIQKAQAAEFDVKFVGWSIEEVNKEIGDTEFVTIYLDAEKPHDKVLHFIIDKMQEKNLEMILIGEQIELDAMKSVIPEWLVFQSFSRPVNNDEYVRAVRDYFSKAAAGDFKKSILIVDDDPQYLTMVREWLRGTYKVSMANSGMQAIKWLGNNRVDLILLDHEMPITTGPQVLEMLRSDEDTKRIPVMFLTGKGDKESVMKVVSLKPEGYFLKNIDRQELLDKLDQFFIMRK